MAGSWWMITPRATRVRTSAQSWTVDRSRASASTGRPSAFNRSTHDGSATTARDRPARVVARLRDSLPTSPRIAPEKAALWARSNDQGSPDSRRVHPSARSSSRMRAFMPAPRTQTTALVRLSPPWMEANSAPSAPPRPRGSTTHSSRAPSANTGPCSARKSHSQHRDANIRPIGHPGRTGVRIGLMTGGIPLPRPAAGVGSPGADPGHRAWTGVGTVPRP